MLFNSFHFLVFFPVVTALYFALPHRMRWALLLAASCYFYMAFIPIYLLILVFTIVVDYGVGIGLERLEGKRKRLLLLMSIVANVGVLAVFKYYNFGIANINALLGVFGAGHGIPLASIILPIGLSFHTFQAMSYTIEVYRGRQKAEKHFGIYALYVMFYPQLVAGPIERPQNLLHQFYEVHRFDEQRVSDGLKLMLWGFFKKVVIADRLAVAVNNVYGAPLSYGGAQLALATLAFAFQIYCDFSGYSDIALGAAKVMGFTLMKNFRRPYFASSISEFWKRWHISLSTWFRDYVYIPLGGNRVRLGRLYFNLLATFTISGLWHGANWTYIVWGALNGFYLVFALATARGRENLLHAARIDRFPVLVRAGRIAGTFLLTCVAWVFFRSRNVPEALYVLGQIPDGLRTLASNAANGAYMRSLVSSFGLSGRDITIALGAVGLLLVVEILQERWNPLSWINSRPLVVRWLAYYAILLIVAFAGAYNSSQQFIYFQF